MRRRQFITLLGGTAAWPLAARGQARDQPRRIGVLMPFEATDVEAQVRVAAFESGLLTSGWVKGRNLLIDYRWAPGEANVLRAEAMSLIANAPDLIVASNTPTLMVLKKLTVTAPYAALFWEPIVSAARSFSVEPVQAPWRDSTDIERAIEMFARVPNGGILALADISNLVQRDLIIALASRNRLPAIYPFRYYAESGGLISYGTDMADVFRRVTVYVDRILGGVKPADLPVQQPTKYELVINLKTARTLGFTIPPTLLATADDVIE